jgi:2-iminobutanoate/2-iminopropanoate deaminase
MHTISTSTAPEPAGHYSQAIKHLGLVFVSGQLPLDPHTREMVPGGIEEQARQTIENVRQILKASGTDLDGVLKSTIFITSEEYWPVVNRIYAEYFGNHKPARAIIPCGPLHNGALLEMEVIAHS